MIGLVMAGGKGSRMNMQKEKLLLEYKKPVIMHVIDALKNSGCFSKVVAATSNNSPETKKLLEQNSIQTIQTPGNGYSEDLSFVLQKINDVVFVTSGDLPFLDVDMVKKIVSQSLNHTWISFVVRKSFLDSVGLSADYAVTCQGNACYYTGVSIVDGTNIKNLDPIKEHYVILDDKKIAFNLNTKSDYELITKI